MDCTARLIIIFGNSSTASNFSCTSTKCEAIVTNVIAPDTDAGNHGDVKLFPIIIRSSNETSDAVAEYIVKVLTENNLVAFGRDNANVNFSGLNQANSNNVYSRLKNDLGDHIIGSG
ncbi:hypothetical protein PR048_005119 [Dryococelus australis]|uniref:Uncharacterized protein n=1 Tax=Dryococelus australis TaxID=614101 RepID=A0ABQ9I9E9_9NEOP|nr:hypothetical protein PR048_005119 [Dryococelus australis]